jgi:hypothetical protein
MRNWFLIVVLSILPFGASPLVADEVSDPDSGWAQPRLPAVKYSKQEDFYPDAARLHDIQGRVLVAFDITPAGVAKNITVLWAEQEVFTKPTVRMLQSVHFAVPDDWLATGAWRRWRAGVVYRLASPAPPQTQSDEFAVPVEKVYVTGSSIPQKYQSRFHDHGGSR